MNTRLVEEPASRELHALRRLAFGPTPGLVEQVSEQGLDAWVDDQLHPERLDYADLESRLANLPALFMDPTELFETYNEQDRRGEPIAHLRLGSLVRQISSPAQLEERMVEFWSDHFNIGIEGSIHGFAKVIEDKHVIRANAFTTFGDLLVASAQSPAMLWYLDNARSFRGAMNENYARELLELHTVGVQGAHFNEDDVVAVAQLLTG